jgi:CheY-like chemotaxis protein
MSRHILLVEDNEMNSDMLSRRLARRGFRVTVAESGERALQLAAQERPDLVLMDLGLPGMSGLEATRRLKGNPATARVPIVVLTAHAINEERASALAAGCDAFATKPIDLQSLLVTIEQMAPGRTGE